MTLLAGASVSDVEQLDPFTFRWPAATETFEGGWSYTVTLGGIAHRVKHGIGGREVYGRERVHTVTWLDGEVQVEGVEADDYPSTRSLLSVLRLADKKLVRVVEEISADYEGFDVVEHRREIDAKWSRNSLAVKIQEDDLAAWGVHAALRFRERTGGPKPVPPMVLPPPMLPRPPTLERQAVAAALLAHGRALAAALGGGTVRFTHDEDANTLSTQIPLRSSWPFLPIRGSWRDEPGLSPSS